MSHTFVHRFFVFIFAFAVFVAGLLVPVFDAPARAEESETIVTSNGHKFIIYKDSFGPGTNCYGLALIGADTPRSKSGLTDYTDDTIESWKEADTVLSNKYNLKDFERNTTSNLLDSMKADLNNQLLDWQSNILKQRPKLSAEAIGYGNGSTVNFIFHAHAETGSACAKLGSAPTVGYSGPEYKAFALRAAEFAKNLSKTDPDFANWRPINYDMTGNSNCGQAITCVYTFWTTPLQFQWAYLRAKVDWANTDFDAMRVAGKAEYTVTVRNDGGHATSNDVQISIDKDQNEIDDNAVFEPAADATVTEFQQNGVVRKGWHLTKALAPGESRTFKFSKSFDANKVQPFKIGAKIYATEAWEGDRGIDPVTAQDTLELDEDGNDEISHDYGVKVCKVTFDSQGGSDVQGVTIPGCSSPVNVPNNPTRDGYNFLKWTTDKSGEKSYNFADNVKSDITLYAQWAEIKPVLPPRDNPVPTLPETGTSVLPFSGSVSVIALVIGTVLLVIRRHSV